VTDGLDLLCYSLLSGLIFLHGKIRSVMKQLFGNKSFILALGVISVLLLALLAVGLESLEFNKGTPFTYSEVNNTSGTGAIEPPELDWVITFGVFIILAVTIFILIIATPKQRRIILLLLLLTALLFLGIMWWISSNGSGGTASQPTAAVLHTPLAPEATAILIGTQIPGVIYTAPSISPWISFGITFAVLIVGLTVMWIFFRHRWRNDVPLDDLAGIAEQTVSDLQSGRDYGDAIINCYANMTYSVNRLRGIRRRGNLTPEEFIAVLERARLPPDPVRRLTALFERVRYGGKPASQDEIDEAVTCLTEIVSAIREVR
jgi:hypothetical protein